MGSITVRKQPLTIDIRSELETYDWGYRATWTYDKLIAQSPFRNDKSPSFYVILSGEFSGMWGDSGAEDDYYAKGGFVKLLAYLRGETQEETEDYLLYTYGTPNESGEINLRIPRMRHRRIFRPLPESILTPTVSPYLISRGISEEVQKKVGIGYGRHKGFTAIPWRRSNGVLANVMYRSTRGKYFFYEKGGQPLRENVWGIDVIYKNTSDRAVICEAPIDAMSWMTAGVPAIAVGGASMSKEQSNILRRSPVRTVWLGGDNDAAGRKFNALVAKKMRWTCVEVREVDYGAHKDANDVLRMCGADSLRQLACTNK